LHHLDLEELGLEFGNIVRCGSEFLLNNGLCLEDLIIRFSGSLKLSLDVVEHKQSGFQVFDTTISSVNPFSLLLNKLRLLIDLIITNLTLFGHSVFKISDSGVQLLFLKQMSFSSCFSFLMEFLDSGISLNQLVSKVVVCRAVLVLKLLVSIAQISYLLLERITRVFVVFEHLSMLVEISLKVVLDNKPGIELHEVVA
jgi:hypothetical protein